MKTVAAVLVEQNRLLELMELEVPVLKPGQVLVELLWSGVCYTQVMEWRGHKGKDPFLPHCLGHEGVGAVLEVGAGVSKVKAGDRVVLSWIKGSGADVPSTVYQAGALKVNSGAITTFGRHAVISENRLTPLIEGVDPRTAALLGCALPTGFGAVVNTAAVRAGQSVVVFGVGGVGLCSVAAAVVSGGTPVVAVDINPARLALAKDLGATHCVNPAEGNVIEALGKIVKGGFDVAIEASGRPEVIAQALSVVRNQGGAAVVIGNAKADERVTIDPKQFNMGKQLRGTLGGDTVPDRDMPRLMTLLRDQRMDLQGLLSAPYRLSDINQALLDIERGAIARQIIDLRAG